MNICKALRKRRKDDHLQSIQGKKVRTVNVVLQVIMFIALGVGILSAYYLAITNAEINRGERYYEELSEGNDRLGPKAESGYIDVSRLQKINSNVKAWLTSNDGKINYPVMQAKDYGHYLSHLPDGTINGCGSLFTDVNAGNDLSGEFSIIYGKQINGDVMFGSLTKYKKQRYYNQNESISLHTDKGTYEVELLYGCEITGKEWRNRAFSYKQNVQSLLGYAKKNTTFTSEKLYSKGDKIIVLSTIDEVFEGKRFFVIGRLKR